MRGAARLVGLSIIVAALGACNDRRLVAAAPQVEARFAPAEVLSAQSNSIVVSGPVSAISSDGFTLNEGWNDLVNVSTAHARFAGASPYPGERVQVTGSGQPGTPIDARAVAEQIVLPQARVTHIGRVIATYADGFTLQLPDGSAIAVTTDARTSYPNGMPRKNWYAQSVGPGDDTTQTAHYVAVWSMRPPRASVGGTVLARSPGGFTVAVPSQSPVTVILVESTKHSGWPIVVGGSVAVSGNGSFNRGIVARTITVPTPSPAPTPKPIVLVTGGIVGLDDQFAPPDGDTPSGGTSQTVDDMPCAPNMAENAYHVHAYLGILVNGVQYAVPDQIGLYSPGPIQNGYTWTARCYYDVHFHDATGMIHLESPSHAALDSSIFTLGNVLDVWGMPVTANGLGPFSGMVRTFVARAPFGTTDAVDYREVGGDPNAIALYSHEAVWLEVGAPYVLPPQIPAIQFYTQY